ncbi:MAG: 3-hydroxyacyl-CoA dehydrogenase NAD-binding domain-containing protein [Candidatus Acidiferrales bacterium]
MEVKTIGIIGARGEGRHLACAALLGGFNTILEDVSPEVLAVGVASIRAMLDDLVTSGNILATQRDSALGNLATSRSVEDVAREAELLIDALPEELEVKLEIFTIFDKFAKPGAILASATRETPIADLAGMTFRMEGCVGMRLLGAPLIASALEIVRTTQTADATIFTCSEVARRMGLQVKVTEERDS